MSFDTSKDRCRTLFERHETTTTTVGDFGSVAGKAVFRIVLVKLPPIVSNYSASGFLDVHVGTRVRVYAPVNLSGRLRCSVGTEKSVNDHRREEIGPRGISGRIWKNATGVVLDSDDSLESDVDETSRHRGIVLRTR